MAAIPAVSTVDSDAGPGDLETFTRLGKAVGDRLRAGILQALHQESYSVGELCELFEVAQPALSHHLKILHQAALVARRREGNSIFYRRAPQNGNPAAAALLTGLDGIPLEASLKRRVRAIHRDRNRRSAEFFAINAAEIHAHQAEICEPETCADLVMDMLEGAVADGLATAHVMEVGPGGGQLLARLNGLFEHSTGIDSSASMLAVTRQALATKVGLRLRQQDFLSLPRQRRYDALVAAMVIHHQASPAAFFAQAARVLRPDGALITAELCRHDQKWASDACGDQWLGFEPEELEGWAASAGFTLNQSQYFAQKNGFRVQVHRFQLGGLQFKQPSNSNQPTEQNHE